MLTAHPATQSLLLCLLIVRNAVVSVESSDKSVKIGIPEVAKLRVPESSNESDATSPARESRILEGTTVLTRENRRYRANATLSKKIEEETEGDDPTTTNFPISPESSSSRTMEFRPSVHIGEIQDYQSRKSATNPFNNVHHIKFENSVNIDDQFTDGVRAPSTTSSSLPPPRVADRKNRVKFYDTDGRYSVTVPVEYYLPQEQQQQQQQHQHLQMEQTIGNEHDNHNNNNDNYHNNQLIPMPMGHEAVVTFEYPRTHYAEVTSRPVTLVRPAYPTMVTDQHQVHLQHHEPGTINNLRTFYVKPSKFHGELVTPMPPVHIQHYEYLAPITTEVMEKPDTLRHQGSYQVLQQPVDNIGIAKPDALLLLSSNRETGFTRTRKFPYKFYHPDSVHQENDFYYLPEGQHPYAPKMSVSPWKKIIHLIGAFLPLGLLLATLKPNIVHVDTENSTQPNIVLSKLRDLPVEHKRGRLEKELDNVQQQTCDDKSICEMIVRGSEPHADLLHNILWDLTNRSTDEEAKKHGLEEIFAAVKQKDCSSIAC